MVEIDTTGTVYVQSAHITDRDSKVAKRWADLDAFAQGYVEALFSAHSIERTTGDGRRFSHGAFDLLAGATLARIITDCEAAIADGYDNTVPAGSTFYAEREEGYEPAFPPLTVLFGDDGKVRFAA